MKIATKRRAIAAWEDYNLPLRQPHEQEPAMTKDEVLKKHKQYLFPSISTYYTDPLVTDHASMQHLWDVEGNKYLDFFGGIVTISVGHANPRVTGKIKDQVDRLQHASTVFPNENVVALAEKIAQITPGEISQSFFTNSGTEANEFAVQLARMHTGRFEIVTLRHGYSGRSALAQSMARSEEHTSELQSHSFISYA